MRKTLVFLLIVVATACAALPLVHPASRFMVPKTTIKVAEGPTLDSRGYTFPIAGQDPVEEVGIVIDAPEFCDVGELVRLDATESQVDGLTWQVLPYTEDFEVIEDGRRAFFSARPGGAPAYLFIVAGAKDGKPYLQHFTITVKGQLPPGPLTLSQQVASWVSKVQDYEEKDAHCLALANVFRELAVKEDVSVDQILEATALANTAVLGEDLDKWVPFLESLGKELDAILEAGALKTREDYKDTWVAIADGLERAVPKSVKEELKKKEA